MTAAQDRWLHTPEAKKALSESLAWAVKNPARASDLSAWKKMLNEGSEKSADGATTRVRCGTPKDFIGTLP